MFQTFILALTQGVTEFLPVSSSGHLLILEKFGISNQSLAFDAALHLGTLAAVVLYFLKDLLALFFGFWRRGAERTLCLQLILASIPIFPIGFFAKDFIETALRTPVVLATTAILFGILLWYVDIRAVKNKTIRRMSYRDAFVIGMFQVLALIPGVSRSGITITTARALGIKRTDAAKFSMLLSIPTIAVIGGYAFWQMGQSGTMAMNDSLLMGIILSAIFGFCAIGILMQWVKKTSFAFFAIYRVLLGLVLLALFL